MNSPDKEKVVPPKKSKAARKANVLDEGAADDQPTELPEQNGHADDTGKASDVAGGSENEVPVNIFKEEIVEGKRKRNAPVAEQTLLDWLKKNFVEKENSYLSKNDMYQSYLESCSSAATFAMDFIFFHKTVDQMFPKGLSLAEGSPYVDAIREQKPKKKNAAKIQADSLNLKMKDIIKEAIVELGDPRKGIMFSAIKNHIAGKFPALRVDLRVNFLKNAIIRAHRLGQIDCVRGVGACGCYRLPRTPEQDAEERELEKKEAQEKLLKKKQKKNPSSSEEKTDETEDGGEKAEASEETNKEKEKETEEVAPENAEEKEKPKEKTATKKKSKHRKKPEKEYYAAHSEPHRIEDAFPLAMTYNSEPKEASVAKIRKYIKDFYREDVSIEKLKKCLDAGVEHGFWFQVTGHGSGSGSFRLTINEFDPLADDDLTGQVMNGIVACTEPKQSSALLLKKYVQDYHPNFRVAERPHLFKMALQRAINKNQIIQLSGIGATGTFQLVNTFLPRPSVLQGQDTAGSGVESDVEVSENVASYQDAYQPRPTKRRGMGRPRATAVNRLDPSAVNLSQPASKPSKGKITKKSSRNKGKSSNKKYVDSSSESSEEEVEEKPSKKPAQPAKRRAVGAARSAGAGAAKKSKLSKPAAKKVGKVAASRQTKEVVTPESESEEYDSEPEVYTPRKTTSRDNVSGQRGVNKATSETPAKGKKAGDLGKNKSVPKSKGRSVQAVPAVPEVKKPTGKGKKSQGAAKSQRGKRKSEDVDSSEGENETGAYMEVMSSPKTGRKISLAARMQAQPAGEEENEADSSQLKTPKVKITIMSLQPKGSPKKGSGKPGKTAAKEPSRSSLTASKEDEKLASTPKSKKGKAVAKKAKKKGAKSRK